MDDLDDDKAGTPGREDFELTITPIGPDHAFPLLRAPTSGDPFAPRRTRRQHLLRTGATWALALGVTAAVLIGSLRPLLWPSAHRSLASVPPPSPPRIAVERGRVFFTGWVPWGQLRVDQGPASALASQLVYPAPDGFQWPSFVLPPGRHTLTYAAADFPTLVCTLSVPEGWDDTCPTSHLPVGSDAGPLQVRRVLLLPTTPERLPPGLSASLADVVQGALDMFAASAAPRSFATVAPGEPLQLAPSGQILRATAPLRALPRYQLNHDPAAATTAVLVAPTSACVTLCAAEPQVSLYPDETAWPIAADVAVSWAYRGTDGQPAASVAGVPAANLPPLVHVRVDVAVWRDGGGWQAQVLQPPFCQAGLQQVDALSVAPDQPLVALPRWAPLSLLPSVDGCLLVGYLADGRGGTADKRVAIVYRFGVLLAANPLARQLYPQLAAATPGEVARVQAVVGA